MYELFADNGKVLTNGSTLVKMTVIFAEELNDWYEIDDPDLK
jgi:hypothetical protein